MTRKIGIHRVGPGSAVRNGAADTMLLVRQRLAEFGFDSEIFSDDGESSWPSPLALQANCAHD